MAEPFLCRKFMGEFANDQSFGGMGVGGHRHINESYGSNGSYVANGDPDGRRRKFKDEYSLQWQWKTMCGAQS
jgi:hypothetical protein